MVTDDELKKHFGPMWEFQHLVNLRDNPMEMRNRLEESRQWARIELEKTVEVVEYLRRLKDTERSVDHFSRSVAILRELIGE